MLAPAIGRVAVLILQQRSKLRRLPHQVEVGVAPSRADDVETAHAGPSDRFGQGSRGVCRAALAGECAGEVVVGIRVHGRALGGTAGQAFGLGQVGTLASQLGRRRSTKELREVRIEVESTAGELGGQLGLSACEGVFALDEQPGRLLVVRANPAPADLF